MARPLREGVEALELTAKFTLAVLALASGVYTYLGVRDLLDGSATGWERVAARDWIPDSGRILRLQAVLRGVDGRGGAYVKPLPQRDDDLLVGWVNRPDDLHVSFFEVATTSREEFVYRVDPGVTLSLYAVGFAVLALGVSFLLTQSAKATPKPVTPGEGVAVPPVPEPSAA